MGAVRNFLRNSLLKAASIPLLQPQRFGGNFLSFFGESKSNQELYKGWVFACVNSIKEEVAQIDLKLYRNGADGQKELVLSHPVLTLLHDVNPFFTKYTLFEHLQANIELWGNEYWLIERNNKGLPLELYPLDPDKIQPVSDPFQYIASYKYQLQGKTYEIPAENIIHFKTFNPKNVILGMSTVEAARAAIETDEAAKLYNRAFFENGANPGTILEYPGNLNKDQMDRLKDQWDSQFAGFKKAYRTAIAQGGLKIHQIEMSHGDMQFIEQRKLSRDEICAMFKVPLEILGVLSQTTYASAKAAEYVFMRRTIRPKEMRIVDTLNEFLLPLFGEDGLFFEATDRTPNDTTESIAYYQSGIANGWLSPNDVRRMEGLPELEDGENVYLPFSLTPYSKPAAKRVNERPSIKGTIDGMAARLTKAITEEIGKVNVIDNTDEQVGESGPKNDFEVIGEAKVITNTKKTDPYIKLFASTAMKLFDGQKKRAIKALEKEVKVFKAKKLNLLDPEKEVSITIDLFTPLFKDFAAKSGRDALTYIGLDPNDFDINSPSMQEFLVSNTKKFAGAVTEKTTQDIRALIVAGLEQGEAITELTKRIEEYSGFGKPRAEMIARSETVRSQAEAERAAWEESGVVTSLIWYTALDDRVDETCNSLHGKEIDISDSFLTENQLLDMGINPYLGDLDGPPIHPNCRCTLLPVTSSKGFKRSLTQDEKLQLYLCS